MRRSFLRLRRSATGSHLLRRRAAADVAEARLGESEMERLWCQRCLVPDGWRQPRLMSEWAAILSSSDLDAAREGRRAAMYAFDPLLDLLKV